MTYPIDFGCVSLSDFFVKPEVEIWRFFDCLCKYSVAVTDDIEMVCSLCLLPALALKVECRISNIEYQTNLTDVGSGWPGVTRPGLGVRRRRTVLFERKQIGYRLWPHLTTIDIPAPARTTFATCIGLQNVTKSSISTPCPDKKGATDFFTITFTNMHGFLWFLVHTFANEY